MTDRDEGIARLDRADEFEEDIGRVFGDRAQGFSPDLMGLLQALWSAGYDRGIVQGSHEGRERGLREGHEARAVEEYDRGLAQGRRELGVLFTKVIRGRKVDDVLRVTEVGVQSGRLTAVLQPWVVEAFQKIVDAPSLEAAAQALELAERSVGERIGDRLFSDPALAGIVRPSVIVEEP